VYPTGERFVARDGQDVRTTDEIFFVEAHLAKLDLKQFARRGAEARVAELNAELAQIYRAFPDMRRRRLQSAGAAADSQTGSLSRRRRRKGMSAAQKKAVSIRMKKYWAGRRKAQTK
jgi:hypothetical protein